MEMIIEKVVSRSIVKNSTKESDRNIAKMNLAYSNPTKKALEHKGVVSKIIKESKFSDEYERMEEIYKSGYLGFDESLNHLG